MNFVDEISTAAICCFGDSLTPCFFFILPNDGSIGLNWIFFTFNRSIMRSGSHSNKSKKLNANIFSVSVSVKQTTLSIIMLFIWYPSLTIVKVSILVKDYRII